MSVIVADEHCVWQNLADASLAGRTLSREICLSVLRSADEELLELLAATYRVRREHFGRKVQLYYLQNAKSGLCPEDCGYCSQSKLSTAPIDKYAWLNEDKLLDGARRAQANRARDLLHRRQRPRAERP